MSLPPLRPEEKERDMYIVKSNSLIQQSRFSLSLEEQRILLYLISKIKPTDKEMKRQEIDIKDYCKVCGISLSDIPAMYDFIKKTIQRLADKSFWLLMDDKKEHLLRWIDKAVISKNEGKVAVRLNEDLLPYLIQVKKNYTQYALASVVVMKCKYSPRLYEILKSYLHFYDRKSYETFKEFSIDELMTILGIEEKTKQTYRKNITMFKKNVIEKAIEEINYYTDIGVKIDYIRTKRTITGIRFNIVRLSTKDQMDNADRAYNELDGKEVKE